MAEPGWGKPHSHKYERTTEISPGTWITRCACGAPGPVEIEVKRGPA